MKRHGALRLPRAAERRPVFVPVAPPLLPAPAVEPAPSGGMAPADPAVADREDAEPPAPSIAGNCLSCLRGPCFLGSSLADPGCLTMSDALPSAPAELRAMIAALEAESARMAAETARIGAVLRAKGLYETLPNGDPPRSAKPPAGRLCGGRSTTCGKPPRPRSPARPSTVSASSTTSNARSPGSPPPRASPSAASTRQIASTSCHRGTGSPSSSKKPPDHAPRSRPGGCDATRLTSIPGSGNDGNAAIAKRTLQAGARNHIP